MLRWTRGLFQLVAVCACLAGVARGDQLMTVNWDGDSTADGIGTGTLAGAGVSYVTDEESNAGTNLDGPGWNASLATKDAVGDGVTFERGGVLGGSLFSDLQSIRYNATITNPVLLINFLNPGDIFSFGMIPLTLLDSNNASLAGSFIFADNSAASSRENGFAIRFDGSFDASSLINFT